MPLLDHFRSPLKEIAPWGSISTYWVTTLVGALNCALPADRYRAYGNRRLGPEVEADIAEFDEAPLSTAGNGAATATAVQSSLPAATLTIPVVFPDDVEVRVVDAQNTQRLLAVVELISPGNKKESSERRAFVAKCAAYLQHGVGLLIVDIVTDRRANLHDELMQYLGHFNQAIQAEQPIYSVAYRPTRRGGKNLIDLWPQSLAVGQALPKAPLALKGAFSVTVDLEHTYTEACKIGNVAS